MVLAFVHRRVKSPELAADLTAEVFAAALEQRISFDDSRGSARAWLCAIAANKIADSYRRGQVEDHSRRRIGLPPLDLDDDDVRRVEETVTAAEVIGNLDHLLATLPPDVRDAVNQRVLSEREYSAIAADLQCSESVVRKRVSRGLKRLRTQVVDRL